MVYGQAGPRLAISTMQKRGVLMLIPKKHRKSENFLRCAPPEATLFFLSQIGAKKGVASGGVHLKKFSDFLCFFGININTPRFCIVEIANRGPAWPYTISYFLPQPALHILSQIVHIILTLSKSNVQHKESLRCRLAPKSREFEGTNQAAVHHVNYPSSVYGVASKAIRVP